MNDEEQRFLEESFEQVKRALNDNKEQLKVASLTAKQRESLEEDKTELLVHYNRLKQQLGL